MGSPLDHALPVLYALFVWWFSTGVVLYLDGLPPRTFRWSFGGATLLLVLGLALVDASGDDPTRGGAYLSFTGALLIWAWNEIGFLVGFVTGSRTAPCPPGCAGWRHFRHAAETILHHELAIAACAVAVVLVSWDAPNRIGALTFLALWAMRLSTKLNIYLGVPNLNEDFLPDHLRHLTHFFRRRPMNGLFPVSVTLATLATAAAVQRAAAAGDPFEGTGFALVAALLALGTIEHWFLVLPLPSEALFRWGLRSRERGSGAEVAPRAPAAAAAGRGGLHRRVDQARAALDQEVAEGGGDR